MSQLSDAARVGVVGGDEAAVAAVEDAGGRPRAGTAAEVVDADTDAVVAVGEAALLDLVPAGVDVPVLPVDAGPGVWSVPTDDLAAAVDALLAGAFDRRELATFAADAPGDGPSARALTDLLVVTEGPARISEFSLAAEGEPLATLRADGVVVATPAGSVGYARRAGGPVVAPDAPVAAVVPVAPFAIAADHWVVPPRLTIRVEREEATVELRADGRRAGVVPPGTPLSIRAEGSVPVAVTDASGPFDPGR